MIVIEGLKEAEDLLRESLLKASRESESFAQQERMINTVVTMHNAVVRGLLLDALDAMYDETVLEPKDGELQDTTQIGTTQRSAHKAGSNGTTEERSEAAHRSKA